MKRKTYKRMVQRNVADELRVRRGTEYKSWKRKVKELENENNRKVEEEFDIKLSEKFLKNKKLFWRKVKKEREGEGKVSI